MLKKKLLLLIPVIVLVIVAATWYMRRQAQDDPNVIRVSGNIEVTDAEVSFKIPGKVEERLVSEGEMVKAGQVAARLEGADLAQEVALRQAEVRAAEAALAELQAGSRPEEIAQVQAAVHAAQSRLDEFEAGSRPQEIALAEASVQRALADEQYSKIELERYRQLLESTAISQGEYDRAKAQYDRALALLNETQENLKLVKEGPRREQIEQARAAVAEAQQRYELVRNGPRKESIEQARARLEQTRAALGLAETRLGYAIVICPLSGIVLSEHVEAGEYVAPGTPVITVGDLEHVWLRAYINETDLGRIKLGRRVRLTADTYPGKVYDGTLSFIASEAEFTPKNVQTQQERVKLVYRVKIDVANPDMELKPGMPADAEILLQEGVR